MTIERRQVGARLEEWKSERGWLAVERPSRRTVIYRGGGHLAAELAELFVQSSNDAIAVGRPHLFWDGEGMMGYDSQVRIRIGTHCIAIKDRVAAMNVYAPSRFVAMGAAVINLGLGGFFNIVKTRDELERLIAEATALDQARAGD